MNKNLILKRSVCCGILERMGIKWVTLDGISKCMPYIEGSSDGVMYRVNNCPSCGAYVRDVIIGTGALGTEPSLEDCSDLQEKALGLLSTAETPKQLDELTTWVLSAHFNNELTKNILESINNKKDSIKFAQ